MEIWGIALSVVLALCVLGLLVRLYLLHRDLAEIARELEEKLAADTNAQISISTGDRAVRSFAAQINVQLASLRRERLRLQCGDAELKAAITNISHDLRTPLTAICGYLELLEQETHTEKSKRYLAIIRERTDVMRALTEELLQYSVITSAEDGFHPEPISLHAILEQSLAAFYGIMTQHGITPDIRLPQETVIRTLDAGALRRIFDNILSNAVKYSDGDLSVALLPDGSVTFSNAAKKLDPVRAEQLFERFFTVESASGSTGLGLSIAKQLTEKMGGQISAGYSNGRLHICVCFPEEGETSL